MKNKLVIITAVLILMISNIFSIKANAAESMASGTWTYNGNEYIFYKYQGDVTYTSSSEVLTFHLTEPTYIINTSGGLVFASRTQYTVVYDTTKLSTGVTYPSNGSYSLLSTSSGNTVFYVGIVGYFIDQIPITDLSLNTATMNAFVNFIESDSFIEPEIPATAPDISDLEEDTSLNLVGFTADNNVNVSWTGISNEVYANSESYAVVELIYEMPLDDDTYGPPAGKTVTYTEIFSLLDNGFVLPWEDIQESGYLLKQMRVIPVGAIIGGDGVNTYVKGIPSYIHFDSLGDIAAPSVVDSSFSLVGFTADNSINAYWSGVVGLDDSSVIDNMIVQVKPSYLLELEAGEEQQSFSHPGTIEVDYSSFSFSKPYDDYFVDNPYVGRSSLTLTFFPAYYVDSINTIYRGQGIKVNFNQSGLLSSVSVPDSALTEKYDANFHLTDVNISSEYHNRGYNIVHARWLGATRLDELDTISSYIRVQLYVKPDKQSDVFNWIDYDMGYYNTISYKYVKFNLLDIQSYASSLGYTFGTYDGQGFDGYKIRLIPYYRTQTSLCYGRAVEITFGHYGSIEYVGQSISDIFDGTEYVTENLEGGYFEDNTIFGDVVDNIVNDNLSDDVDIDSLTLNFFTMLQGLLSACGLFPTLFSTVYGFLPDWITVMIGLSVSLVVILRVIGR